MLFLGDEIVHQKECPPPIHESLPSWPRASSPSPGLAVPSAGSTSLPDTPPANRPLRITHSVGLLLLMSCSRSLPSPPGLVKRTYQKLP